MQRNSSRLEVHDDKIINAALSFTWPEYSSSVPKRFFPFQESSSTKKDTVRVYIVKNNSCVLVYHRIRLKSRSLAIFLLLSLNSRNACSESKMKSSKIITLLRGQKHAKNNFFLSVSVHKSNLAGKEHDELLLSMASKQNSGMLRIFSVAGPGTTYTFVFRYLLPSGWQSITGELLRTEDTGLGTECNNTLQWSLLQVGVKPFLLVWEKYCNRKWNY